LNLEISLIGKMINSDAENKITILDLFIVFTSQTLMSCGMKRPLYLPKEAEKIKKEQLKNG